MSLLEGLDHVAVKKLYCIVGVACIFSWLGTHSLFEGVATICRLRATGALGVSKYIRIYSWVETHHQISLDVNTI